MDRKIPTARSQLGHGIGHDVTDDDPSPVDIQGFCGVHSVLYMGEPVRRSGTTHAPHRVS